MGSPDFDILQAVAAAQGSSEAVGAAAQATKLFGLLSASPAQRRAAGLRTVSPAQIRTLKAHGNTAEDWKQVWVGPGFDARRIERCDFLGTVVLSESAGNVEVEGVQFPAGLQHATISSCVIGKNALVATLGSFIKR